MIPGLKVLRDHSRVFFRQDIRRAALVDGAALKIGHFCSYPADLAFPYWRMNPAGIRLEQLQIQTEYSGCFLHGIGRWKPTGVQLGQFLLYGRKIIVHLIGTGDASLPFLSKNGFVPSQVNALLGFRLWLWFLFVLHWYTTGIPLVKLTLNPSV